MKIKPPFMMALLALAAASAFAVPARAEMRPSAGFAECKRLYQGADLKTCIAQVNEIVWVIRHPPREAPKRLIQPNILYGLP